MKNHMHVSISSRTWALLYAAGRETGSGIDRFSTLAVDAALRLYSVNRLTTAVPRIANREQLGSDVSVSLSNKQLETIFRIADDRGMTFGTLLRAILDASVQAYEPIPHRMPSPSERAVATPRRRPPFDPAYYAQHAAAFK